MLDEPRDATAGTNRVASLSTKVFPRRQYLCNHGACPTMLQYTSLPSMALMIPPMSASCSINPSRLENVMEDMTSNAYQCSHLPKSTSVPTIPSSFRRKISEHASFIGSSSRIVLIEYAFATGRLIALWAASSLTLKIVGIVGPAGVLGSKAT